MSDYRLGTCADPGYTGALAGRPTTGLLRQFGDQVILDGDDTAIRVVTGPHLMFVGDRVLVQQVGGQAYVIEVVSSAYTEWTAMPYAGYYVSYGGLGTLAQRDTGYRRVNGYAEMRGLAKMANSGSTTITVLPSGCRPSQIEIFDTTFSATGAAFSGSATLQVATDGTVTIATGGVSVGGWVSLSSIHFQADGS